MPKTRDPIQVPGDYVSHCHCRTRVAGEIGFSFPACAGCGKPVEWALLPDEEPEGSA